MRSSGRHQDFRASTPSGRCPTYKIVRFLIFAFAAVLVFPYLPGSSSPAFKGVSVFLGVLFSLGSASSVGNMMAGVVLTYMRAFQTGDRVKVADTVGDVVGKNLLVVRVRTIKNVEVTIPNAIVLTNHIINYSTCARDSGLILHATVTIGYDAPWRKVHELLLAAARSHRGTAAERRRRSCSRRRSTTFTSTTRSTPTPTSRTRWRRSTPSSTRTSRTRSTRRAWRSCLPTHVSARDGNRMAIPDQYLPQAYEAPAFRVLPVDAKKPK